MHRSAGELVVARSYAIVSSCGTRGNAYQRLLEFTTARRKAPDNLLFPVLARYQTAQLPRPAPTAPHGDGPHPVECVTIAIPDEPRRTHRGRAGAQRGAPAARTQGRRRP
jgi:hypothetical protein